MEDTTVIQFTATGSKEITGVFMQLPSGLATITLNGKVGNTEPLHQLRETKKIKDVGNFVASFIKRIDDKQVFNSIKVGDDTFPIIREVISTESFYVIGEHLFEINAVASFTDKNGITVDIPVSSVAERKVELPIDGKYSKNEEINRFLYKKAIDFEDGKKMVVYLQKAIGEASKKFKSMGNKRTDDLTIKFAIDYSKSRIIFYDKFNAKTKSAESFPEKSFFFKVKGDLSLI